MERLQKRKCVKCFLKDEKNYGSEKLAVKSLLTVKKQGKNLFCLVEHHHEKQLLKQHSCRKHFWRVVYICKS